MSWNDPPQHGERWRGRAANGGRETRSVKDRTLGGDVIYVTGDVRRYQHEQRCTEAAWHAWAKKATRIQ